MMATLFSLAVYLLHIVSMSALSYFVYRGVMDCFPMQEVKDLELVVLSTSIFLLMAVKNFSWFALISEFPSTLPSGVFEMIATIVGLVCYLVCMTGLSFVVLYVPIYACEAAEWLPDWMFQIACAVVIDTFINHSLHSTMIGMLFFHADYLAYTLCMTALAYLVFKALSYAFPSFLGCPFALHNSIFLPLTLKNFPWLALMSEFPFSLPSSISEMVTTLIGLAGYLVCMTGLSNLVFIGVGNVFKMLASLEMWMWAGWLLYWLEMILLGANVVVMDMFINHSSHSTMMAMLFLADGHFVYIVCMTGLSYLVFRVAMSAFLVQRDTVAEVFVCLITILLLLALKNFQWLSLISELPSNLPSSVSGMVTTILGLVGYLFCMMGLSFLVYRVALLLAYALVEPFPKEWRPHLIDMIVLGATIVVMDIVINHSSHSNKMAMLLFENLVFHDSILHALPFLRPVALEYKALASSIVAWVILVLNDMHGLAPVEKPAFISESLSTLPFSVSDTLTGYLLCIFFMVALSFLVLIIAAGAICRIRIRWPMERPELMLTTIVGLAFMLLNRMWGTPFEKLSSDSDMKETLVGFAGYLIYILCSTTLSGMLSKSTMDAFFISLTFVVLDMLGVSNIISILVGLVRLIATSVLALFFLVALSFVLSMGLQTWVTILLPSAMNNYREVTFASIIGLSFKTMKTMLDTPAVEKLSFLSNTKAALIGIADLRNDYHVAYLVIRYLTVLSLPCLLMKSRDKTSTCKVHAMTAVIIALGLVLKMPPSTPMPIKDLALHTMVLDDIIQRTVTSFITHTILILVTLIGGMVFYVRHQYHLWKLTIATRCRQIIEHAGLEARKFMEHVDLEARKFMEHVDLEARNYVEDLVYKCTGGWCGKKKANSFRRQSFAEDAIAVERTIVNDDSEPSRDAGVQELVSSAPTFIESITARITAPLLSAAPPTPATPIRRRPRNPAPMPSRQASDRRAVTSMAGLSTVEKARRVLRKKLGLPAEDKAKGDATEEVLQQRFMDLFKVPKTALETEAVRALFGRVGSSRSVMSKSAGRRATPTTAARAARAAEDLELEPPVEAHSRE